MWSRNGKQMPTQTCLCLSSEQLHDEFLQKECHSGRDTMSCIVIQIISHPCYKDKSQLGSSYDIGLIELSEPIVFGPDVCSVCLPPPMFEHVDKETALFAGYGTYDARLILQTGWVSFNRSHIYNNPMDYMQKPCKNHAKTKSCVYFLGFMGQYCGTCLGTKPNE